jgi:hypothetical protein
MAVERMASRDLTQISHRINLRKSRNLRLNIFGVQLPPCPSEPHSTLAPSPYAKA